jgi:hypothetical protein
MVAAGTLSVTTEGMNRWDERDGFSWRRLV